MKKSQDSWANSEKGLGSKRSCHLTRSANFPLNDAHTQECWAIRKWVPRFRLSFIPK